MDTNNELTIAAISRRCSLDKEENITSIVKQIKDIKQDFPNVNLIFFGETILSWYAPESHTELHIENSEKIPGRTTDTFAEVAKQLGIYLSIGLEEKYQGSIFNSQVLLDPSGNVVATHRKMIVKDSLFQRGSEPFTIVEINGFQTAILICADASNFRTMRLLRKASPDLILLSLADDEDKEKFMAKFSAKLYSTWIFTANRFGEEYDHYWNGHIFCSNPYGKLFSYSRDKEAAIIESIEVKNRSNILYKTMRTIQFFSLGWHILKNWKTAISFYR